MADQHIRLRRPKKKGKRGHKGSSGARNSREPSEAKMKVLQACPHLKAPSCGGFSRIHPEDLEGKVFLKFTKKDEVHYQFKWRTGLNEDPVPFRRGDNCGPGGLYFCDLHCAHLWINPGSYWVRRVYPQLDPAGKEVTYHTQKWKAHRVLADEAQSLSDYRTWEWLIGLDRSSGNSLHHVLYSRSTNKGAESRRLRASVLKELGGSLLTALKHLDEELLWTAGQCSSFARYCQCLVSPSDWRASREAYPCLVRGDVSVSQVLWHAARVIKGAFRPTKSGGNSEQG